MEIYRKYLAENVLSESKVVTYRLLSRALQVHPNSAKQMLYEFHKSENGKQPGRVYATYLIYGIKKAESSSQIQNGDGDVEMTSSMPEVESFDDAVPTFTLNLIPEDQLKNALEQYDEVSSIHVYSLGPHPAKDLSLLVDVAQQALTLNNESRTLVITNPNVRRRERKGAVAQSTSSAFGAKAVKQEPKVMKSEPKPVKSDPKSALSKAFASAKPKSEPKSEVKEEPQSEKTPAEPSKAASAAVEKKPAPAMKRGGSNTSSIMQAFSKAKATTKVKKVETSQPATPSGEDSSAHPMSDDGEDDSEMPQPASRSTAGRKTRKEREEDLRRMMDEDDDEEDDDDQSDKRGESPVDEPMDETMDEPAPEPAPAEPAETETTSSNGRRRGKRKVMRKKQIMDDQGYLVTIQEAAWESFSEDEAPLATKPKISSTAASSAPASQTSKPKKGGPKGSQGTQGSIMSFFSKK